MIPPVNLLPWRETQRTAHRKRYWRLFTLTLMFAGVCQLIAAEYIDGETELRGREIAVLKQLTQQYQEKKKQAEVTSALVEEVKRKSDLISDLKDKTNNLTRLMNLLAFSVPENMHLDRLNVSAGRVEIKGASKGSEALKGFITELEKSGLFAEVKTDAIARKEGSMLAQSQKFELSLRLISDEETEGGAE
ncbi:PilN domain-containing protein [Vibrio sp. JC009]|uniref:PilN domain-containing protein n=1 Tax=Vibrio sp. JC009 TaxID=2912314 RepID=UPI0023B0462F|nr:PilN domain-containing protein [Vibrio sp. JC009]WED21632.1 PilN domain-containing protein [Vibrio sp. JC009]